MPHPALHRDRLLHPSLNPRLSATQPVIPTGAARPYSSARFLGDGLQSGGTLAPISISANHNDAASTSLIPRCCLQNPPFVFTDLRIAFSTTPLFSETSA